MKNRNKHTFEIQIFQKLKTNGDKEYVGWIRD